MSNHTHSNRYIYIVNENNKIFKSIKEFLIDQGFNGKDPYVVFSGLFYDNLVGGDGKIMSKDVVKAISHLWHSGTHYEFVFRNPTSGKDIILRRLLRFRKEELV